MAKDEIVEKATTPTPRPSGARPQAAPAAVDETPSHEEAAAIASTTVFEPDAPQAAEPEIEIELEDAAEPVAEAEPPPAAAEPEPVASAAGATDEPSEG